MALLDEQPYVGYPQMGRRRAMPNTDVEMNQGLLRGASYYPYDLLGSPVDLINMALTPIGLGTEKPVMGSAYLQSLAQRAGLSAQPTGSNSENIARLVASLTNPAAGARAVGRVVEPTVQALAPKAGQALESYMVNQGMIQPLTAYHGTPHTIQGQFDINKVGTGEGAQAYGHGMYFAENPSVAKQYLVNAESQKTPEGMARSYLKDYPSEKEAILGAKARLQRLQENGTADLIQQQEQVVKALESNKLGGNLYKVDIPDADIPMMMDLDKPLSQQPKVMGALRSEAEQRVKDRTLVNIENDIRSSLPPIEIGNDYMAMFSDANVKAGQEIKKQALEKLNKMDLSSLINKELESMKPLATNWNMTGKEYYEFLSKNQGSPAKASEMLQRQGITGNRYLDEVSRNRGQGTSNFVVFDPSTVKILEKNSEKVEGLLD